MKRLIFILIIPLATFIIAAIPMQYVSDDWCEHGWMRDYGPVGIVTYLYNNWTGRYAGPLEFSAIYWLKMPGTTTWLGIALCTVAALALFKRYKYGAVAALLLVDAVLATTPDLRQSVYWNPGAIMYLTSVGWFLLLFWVLDRPLASIIAPLLTFVMAGVNDVTAVVQIAVLVFYWILRPDRRKPVTLALVTAFIGIAIVLAAPGNAIRRAYFPPSDFWLAIVFSVRTTATFFAHALRTAPVVLLGVLIIPALVAERCKKSEIPRIEKTMLIVILGIVGLNFSASFTAYFGTGGPLTDRAEIIPVGLTLLGGMYISWLTGRLIGKPKPRLAAALVVLVAAAAVVPALQMNVKLWSQPPTAQLSDLTTADLYRLCEFEDFQTGDLGHAFAAAKARENGGITAP